jgi:hypothetical protein
MTDQSSPSARIDAKLANLGQWRADMLGRTRGFVRPLDLGRRGRRQIGWQATPVNWSTRRKL